jgi:hypothetical protein
MEFRATHATRHLLVSARPPVSGHHGSGSSDQWELTVWWPDKDQPVKTLRARGGLIPPSSGPEADSKSIED